MMPPIRAPVMIDVGLGEDVVIVVVGLGVGVLKVDCVVKVDGVDDIVDTVVGVGVGVVLVVVAMLEAVAVSSTLGVVIEVSDDMRVEDVKDVVTGSWTKIKDRSFFVVTVTAMGELLLLLLLRPSGHPPVVHGSTEQQPVYPPVEQTYHSVLTGQDPFWRTESRAMATDSRRIATEYNECV